MKKPTETYRNLEKPTNTCRNLQKSADALRALFGAAKRAAPAAETLLQATSTGYQRVPCGEKTEAKKRQTLKASPVAPVAPANFAGLLSQVVLGSRFSDSLTL